MHDAQLVGGCSSRQGVGDLTMAPRRLLAAQRTHIAVVESRVLVKINGQAEIEVYTARHRLNRVHCASSWMRVSAKVSLDSAVGVSHQSVIHLQMDCRHLWMLIVCCLE